MGETELARMIVRLMGDATSYIGMMRGAVSATVSGTQMIQGQAAKIVEYQNSLTSFASQVKATLLGSLGVLSLFGAGLKGISLAAETERMATDFGVMLRNMDKGRQLIKDLTQFAAETPLGLGDLTQASKVLLQYSAATQQTLIPTLRMLGDVTGGNSERLQRMSFAFGKVIGDGRLMGDTVNQMVDAGFNPLAEISRTTGKSMLQLRKEMEQGLISVDMVRNAFKTATSEGGSFKDGMLEASKTLSGLWSTLQDDVAGTLRVMGEKLIETFDLKNVVKNLSALAQESVKWVTALFNGVKFLNQQVVNFINTNRELIITGLKVIGVLSGIWASIKIGGIAVGVLIYAMKLLRLDVILSTAVWLAWKVVVLTSLAAMTTAQLIWTAAMAAHSAMTSLATLAVGVYTGAVSIAKIATWLWNAALTVMNALLSPITLLAAAAAISVIVLGIVAAATATALFASGLYAVYKTGRTVIGMLIEMASVGGQIRGPLEEVTKVFMGWGNALDNVFNAMQTDFALAWKFMVAYAQLGAAQVQAVFPPLWQFIQATSTVLWDEVTSQMKQNFREALVAIYDGTMFVLTSIAEGMLKAMNPLTALEFLLGDQEDVGVAIGRAMGDNMGVNMGKAWQLRMKDAVNEFQEAMKNIDMKGIEEAQKRIKDVEVEVAVAEAGQLANEWDQWLKAMGGDTPNPGAPIAASMKQAVQHAEKLQGLMVGSNEGFQRLLDQRDMIAAQRMQPRTNTGLAPSGMKKTEELLNDIKKNTAQANNQPALNVQAANI